MERLKGKILGEESSSAVRVVSRSLRGEPPPGGGSRDPLVSQFFDRFSGFFFGYFLTAKSTKNSSVHLCLLWYTLTLVPQIYKERSSSAAGDVCNAIGVELALKVVLRGRACRRAFKAARSPAVECTTRRTAVCNTPHFDVRAKVFIKNARNIPGVAHKP